MAVALVCSESYHDEPERARRSQLRKWDRISRKGIDYYMKCRPDDFWRRVNRGIPTEHRWGVWKARLLAANSVSSSREAKEREKALFSGPSAAGCAASLLNSESSWVEDIEVDASRTFVDMSSFTVEHEQSCCRVLNAYAFLNPEVGYVQGMNYVVGLLLLASERSEQDALFVFVQLMEDCGLCGFYCDDSPLLAQYVGAFDELMEQDMPDLKRHFAAEGVKSGDYLQQWFLSLFAYCLPLHTSLLVWDIVMCNGLPYLVLAAIALLSSVKEVLLSKSHEEILEFFSSMQHNEDEQTAVEVGRLISHKIGTLRDKIPQVQRRLGIAPEIHGKTCLKLDATADGKKSVRSFDLDSHKPRTSSSRRVSFDLDTNSDGITTDITWYQQ